MNEHEANLDARAVFVIEHLRQPRKTRRPVSLNSVATVEGVGTVFQSVFLSFVSPNQGTITYGDGWNTTGLAVVGFPGYPLSPTAARSTQNFLLLEPGSLDVD